MSLRRKNRTTEHEDNHERWLVSYADFITLLFAFFVVMYALSSVNQHKYRDLTYSLGNAFGQSSTVYPDDTTPVIPALQRGVGIHMPPLPLDQRKQERLQREREQMTTRAISLANGLAPLIHQGKIQIVQNNAGIRIDISDSVLFRPGSAEVSVSAEPLLKQIAEVLRHDRHPLQVEGHTDHVPIHNARFYSNWELSAVRASGLVRMLAKHGIAENRLSAAGFADSRPLADNSSVKGRAKNRRVSIMLLYGLSNLTGLPSPDEGALISPH